MLCVICQHESSPMVRFEYADVIADDHKNGQVLECKNHGELQST